MALIPAPTVTLIANKTTDEDLLCSFIDGLFCQAPQDPGGRWYVGIGDFEPCDERKYIIDTETRFIILNRRKLSAEITLVQIKDFGALFRSVLFILDGLKPIVGYDVIINRLTHAIDHYTRHWIPQVIPITKNLTQTTIIKGLYKKEMAFGKKVAEESILAFMAKLRAVSGVAVERKKNVVVITGKDLILRDRQKMMGVVRQFRNVVGDKNIHESRGGMVGD